MLVLLISHQVFNFLQVEGCLPATVGTRHFEAVLRFLYFSLLIEQHAQVVLHTRR